MIKNSLTTKMKMVTKRKWENIYQNLYKISVPKTKGREMQMYIKIVI